MKNLIINADDFGYSKIFNSKIIELIKNKLISSTSVMVNWINNEQNDQIKELVTLMESHNVSIGLHLEFSSNDFQSEIEQQYKKFLNIFKFQPSHIDIHMKKSIFLKEAYPIIMKFCKNKKIPLPE